MNNDRMMLVVDPEQLTDIVKRSIRAYFAETPNSQHQVNDLMTIAEAAKFLNCSIPTIYAKTSKRTIPFHKQGKRVYFSRHELLEWIKNA